MEDLACHVAITTRSGIGKEKEAGPGRGHADAIERDRGAALVQDVSLRSEAYEGPLSEVVDQDLAVRPDGDGRGRAELPGAFPFGTVRAEQRAIRAEDTRLECVSVQDADHAGGADADIARVQLVEGLGSRRLPTQSV